MTTLFLDPVKQTNKQKLARSGNFVKNAHNSVDDSRGG